MPEIRPLPIAVRVYPEPENVKPKNAESGEPGTPPRTPWKRPGAMLVFDTETRIDATQHLTFGSYRFIEGRRCLEEGLFHADDLSDKDQQILREYAASRRADTDNEGSSELQLLARSEFVDKLYRVAYKSRGLLVGFNLPFDLSRVAFDCANARGRFRGGFSLGLWSYIQSGCEKANSYRPRICIKQIDSKRALKGFTGRNNPDTADLIPEDVPGAKPQAGYKFRGHFLDLRTLAFSLTDRGYSLESACAAFGVEHPKTVATQHGEVTDEYIDYNRRDVLATAELAAKLLEEYDKHPITLQVTKAYSPASIGKAYLRAMGITPILERQRDFPKAYLGYAQSAFFGGRTSAHIRKSPAPVVYTDFLSMYPTVNSLMGLWQFVIARKIRVVEHCQEEIRELLAGISVKDLFTPATWKHLAAFVQIIPEDDILPSRSKYSAGSNDWQVAVNYISSGSDNSHNALWFSLPDVLASVILTGRVPTIINAFRLEPLGTMPGLHPVSLRGTIEVDPSQQDFFKAVIEQRKRVASRRGIPDSERARLDKALKVLANATSYGIYAEMNRQEPDGEVNATCYGIDSEPFSCRAAHPDAPGEYCFPPLASLITGGARLMLSLLENCLTELDGTYAMEDTDSMAIVATEHGGMIPCPGGPHRTVEGQPAIKALSWAQVEQIVQRFTALNPYDRDAISGSILKIESDNFDPQTREQRQLYCWAISAKRYALFQKNEDENAVVLRCSEHGLGHLLNPTDPLSEDRNWIEQAWHCIINKALGWPTEKLSFENLPAIGRITVGSPVLMRPLAAMNENKKYPAQIKPFNFLLTCHVKQMGCPTCVTPERFHLIAPYESNPGRWMKMPWIDQYSGKSYRITTSGHHGDRQTARVKTYGEILNEYEFHPESKCADADGNACEKQTVGLLQRRHISVGLVHYIGKESNRLEAVDAGLIHSAQEVYTEYRDPRRDEWQTKILPKLRKIPLAALEKMSGLSRRALLDIRAARSRPHPKNQQRLTAIVNNLRALKNYGG